VTGNAKDRALRLLGVRWRSRAELETRLAGAGFGPQEIAQALDDLERTGLVEDGRFARELVRDHAARRLSGDRAIRSALRQKGVAGQVAEAALQEAGDEAIRARALADRRAARMAGLDPDAAFRRLVGLLVRRGYPPGLAREASRASLSAVFDPGSLSDAP
jgi:regulatory protein